MEDAQVKDELDQLEFSTRTTNVLRMAGYVTMDQVRELTEKQVTALPNAGRKTWYEIAEWQSWVNPPQYTMTDLVLAIRKVNEIRRYLDNDTMVPPIRLVVRGGIIELWGYIA